MAATQGIRPATEGELDLLPSVYERASFNPRLAAVDRFARAALGGEVFVVEREGGLAGASGCAHFGATGWVGAVAVVPEARRAGLGRALTEAAVAWLRERGAGTIQLYATDMGRPIYERLGFVAEGACVALGGRRQPGPPTGAVRAARPDDLQAAQAVDREATGEDRAALLTSLWPGSALVAEAGGGVRGYHLPSPWRSGGATVAADLVGHRGLEGDRQQRPSPQRQASAGGVADRRGITDPPARRGPVEGELDPVEALLPACLDPDQPSGEAAAVRLGNGGGPERRPRGCLGLDRLRVVHRPDPEQEGAGQHQQHEVSQGSQGRHLLWPFGFAVSRC